MSRFIFLHDFLDEKYFNMFLHKLLRIYIANMLLDINIAIFITRRVCIRSVLLAILWIQDRNVIKYPKISSLGPRINKELPTKQCSKVWVEPDWNASLCLYMCFPICLRSICKRVICWKGSCSVCVILLPRLSCSWLAF